MRSASEQHVTARKHLPSSCLRWHHMHTNCTVNLTVAFIIGFLGDRRVTSLICGTSGWHQSLGVHQGVVPTVGSVMISGNLDCRLNGRYTFEWFSKMETNLSIIVSTLQEFRWILNLKKTSMIPYFCLEYLGYFCTPVLPGCFLCQRNFKSSDFISIFPSSVLLEMDVTLQVCKFCV